MQAQLEQAEFAYLLHTMGAKAVVGVNNRQFFPDQPARRDTLLSDGFAQLKEHGWLVPTDEGIQSNGRLLLLSAVIASPAIVITVTRLLEDNRESSINYYLAGNLIVEQFQSADGSYAVAQLPKQESLASRMAAAFDLPDEAESTPLQFNAATFQPALRAARNGNLAPLKSAFAGEDPLTNELAEGIASLKRAGRIETAAVAGTRLLAIEELGLLRDADGTLWAVQRNEADAVLSLQQLDKESFAVLLNGELAQMALARETAASEQ